MKEVTIIGASLEESVRVRCEVDADPSEVDFMWEFNNSGENFEVAPAKFDGNNGTMSELVYTPESERDYGALTCWGRNTIGKQEAPCIYQVIPAGVIFLYIPVKNNRNIIHLKLNLYIYIVRKRYHF